AHHVLKHFPDLPVQILLAPKTFTDLFNLLSKIGSLVEALVDAALCLPTRLVDIRDQLAFRGNANPVTRCLGGLSTLYCIIIPDSEEILQLLPRGEPERVENPVVCKALLRLVGNNGNTHLAA